MLNQNQFKLQLTNKKLLIENSKFYRDSIGNSKGFCKLKLGEGV